MNFNGLRGRSTTFRSGNGNIVQVINIGVNNEHPMADSNTPQANGGSPAGGLNNINVGGFSMPPPQFVVVNNGQGHQ